MANLRDRTRLSLIPTLLLTLLGPLLVAGGFVAFARTDLGLLCGAVAAFALIAAYARGRLANSQGQAILLVVIQLACAFAVASGALLHLTGDGGMEAGFALGGIAALLATVAYVRPRVSGMPRTIALALAGITGISVAGTALLSPLASSRWWAYSALLAMVVLFAGWIRERNRLPASAYLIGLQALSLGNAGFLYAAADVLVLPGAGLDLIAGLVIAAANAAFLLQHDKSACHGLKVVAVNLAAIGLALVAFTIAVYILPLDRWRDVVTLGVTLLAAAASWWYCMRRIKAVAPGAVLAMFLFAGAYGWVCIGAVSALARVPQYAHILNGAFLGGVIVFALLQLRRARDSDRLTRQPEPSHAADDSRLGILERFGIAIAGAWSLILYLGIFALGTAHWGPSDVLARVVSIFPGAGERAFIQAAMQDRYLWYDQASAQMSDALDTTFFQLPRAKQDRYSYVASSTDYVDWFAHSKFRGLGLALMMDGHVAEIAYVVEDSPADHAGLMRGLSVVAVNGESVAAAITNGRLGAGVPDAATDLTVADPAGNQLTISLSSALVEERRPVNWTNFLQDGKRVGYLFVRSLNPGSAREIGEAFSEFYYRDVSELVLDLRYASSGFSNVALYLASLITGEASKGKVMARFVYNDKYRDRDYEDLLTPQSASLDLERVVVITGPATCGAAELLINGLRPYVQVTTVGATTCGRPVGTESIQFGDKQLVLAVMQIYNANGAGEYFEGIVPHCPVADDLLRPLGDAGEAVLREALYFLAAGSCSGITPQPGSTIAARRFIESAPGLRATIGLY